MKKIISIILILITTFAFAENSESITKISLKDVNGNRLSMTLTSDSVIINGYKDKVVFIELFGHNCPPCMRTVPHLKDLTSRYGDKLKIIAIEVQGYSSSQLKKFAKYKGMNYTVISQDDNTDAVNEIADRAGWNGSIPFLIALRPGGEVVFIQPGYIGKSQLEELVKILSR
jgi:thiol-disulfide isomerase/thioredoxin